MASLGKLLVFLGAAIFIIGAALILFGKTNIPLGRLPGDIIYRGKYTTFYFPLATSIVLSIVLSLLLYVMGRFWHLFLAANGLRGVNSLQWFLLVCFVFLLV